MQCLFECWERLIDWLFHLHLTDCPLSVSTTSLPRGILCHIPATCTSVFCCLTPQVPLNISFSVVLDLDPCNQRILLGIENFVHQISLYDFTFGKSKLNLSCFFLFLFLLQVLHAHVILINIKRSFVLFLGMEHSYYLNNIVRMQ